MKRPSTIWAVETRKELNSEIEGGRVVNWIEDT